MPSTSSVTVANEQLWMSVDSVACLNLTLSLERFEMPSSMAWTSGSGDLKPSKRQRTAMESTAFCGQPTTVSTLRSDGGMLMPKSLRTFLPL